MIKIDKSERDYLISQGVKLRENGISKTYTKYPHYYLSETAKNVALLKAYRESRKVG